MRLYLIAFLALWPPLRAAAAEIKGTVLDPSHAAIAGAQVAAVGPLGVLAQTSSRGDGSFDLRVAAVAGMRIVVTAAGFETRTVAPEAGKPGKPLSIELAIAPQVDSVRVVGSTIDVPMSEQGGSASLIPRQEIEQRNEPFAADLLRYVPGATVAQAGPRGAQTTLFVRGGDWNYNLVQIDGVTVNQFGGSFDFAHIPTDWLDRIEVVRGPQSAVYGPYANTSTVNLVTRPETENFTLDALAEGGTYQERRFALGASGTVKGFGLSAWASRLDGDGPVLNSDYRNENVALHAARSFGRQSLSFFGDFDSNDTGAPGPYGSNPAGLFPGLDTVSRNKNNFSNYLVRYQADLSGRVRQELIGSFFLNNSFFKSPYGDSFNRDLRGQGETRTLVSVTRGYTTAFGFAWAREDEKNSWITGTGSLIAPITRNEEGIYWENRLEFARRLFVNAGARADVIGTSLIPADPFNGRPVFPAHTITKVNPKVAVAYVVRPETRLHASFGTGIRPPAGFDLAFTNNPALKPERTMSLDAGIEQRLLRNRLSLEATYFRNRFSDLIVSLGGSLAQLSAYRSDNLSNARAQGAEFTARLQPARTIAIAATYTYLKSEILSLDGSSGLAPAYFRVGQELLRRPAHTGTLVSSYVRGRVSANLTGYWRGSDLDVEPNWGASAGLFRNPGYFNLGLNLNYRVRRGVTVYGNLRNALNQRYEEVYGYPSLRLNFVSGMKFTLPGSK